MVAENSEDCRSRRQRGDDPADVLDEAEVEHPVGLVEHEMAHLVEPQLAGGQQVADASGRADDDVGARLHPPHLPERLMPPRMATTRRRCIPLPSLLMLSSICSASSRVGARISALAVNGRWRGWGRGKVLQHRQREGRGLAAAGLGDADDVAALQQRRDGLDLDGGRLGEAGLSEGTQKRLGEAERGEVV